MELLREYGVCNVRPGTKLWTWQATDWTLPNRELFCFIDPQQRYHVGFQHYSIGVHTDMKLLCLFRLNAVNFYRAESTFPEVYERIMERPWSFVDDVEFKTSHELRAPFIRKLQDSGIDGWLCPVERGNLMHCEVCIFRPSRYCAVTESDEAKPQHAARVQVTRLGAQSVRRADFLPRAERQSLRDKAVLLLKEIEEDGMWTPVDKYLQPYLANLSSP